jgi:conjugal transfer pilin signal peptidase TrbI
MTPSPAAERPAVVTTGPAARGAWERPWAAQRALARSIARRGYLWLALGLAYLWAVQHVGINWTPSLPHHLVLIEPGAAVDRGDLIVFRFEGGEIAHHLKGQRFFKRIAGVAGDVITLQGRQVRVNGEFVGLARERTVDHQPLEPIEPGVIPPERFYVQGTHEMSFDSRYRVNGLIRRDQIIGKATVIF